MPRRKRRSRSATVRGLEHVGDEGPYDSSPSKLVFVPCPPGMKLTGGGAYISPQIPELAAIRSERGGGGSGWIAHAGEASPYAGNWKVGATAICAKVAP